MKTAQAFLHPCILQCYCCSSHISSINLSAAAHSFTLFSPTKHPASCAPVPPQPPPPQALSHSDLTCASPTWGTEPSNNQAWVLKQQNLTNHFVLASLSCCYSCVHLDLSSKPFCPSWYRGSPSQMSFSASHQTPGHLSSTKCAPVIHNSDTSFQGCLDYSLSTYLALRCQTHTSHRALPNPAVLADLEKTIPQIHRLLV